MKKHYTRLAQTYRTVLALLLWLAISPCIAQRDNVPIQLIERESEAVIWFGQASAALRLQADAQLIAPGMLSELQRLTDELANAANTGIRHRVYVLNSPQENMFTLPTGEIFIFSGFLDKVENRDELAFGLAHEIAHFRLEHGRERFRNSFKVTSDAQITATILARIVAAATSASVGSVAGSLGTGVTGRIFDLIASQTGSYVGRIAAKVPVQLVAQSAAATLGRFSQAQELEADRLALVIMTKTGHSADAATTLIQKLSDRWHRGED